MREQFTTNDELQEHVEVSFVLRNREERDQKRMVDAHQNFLLIPYVLYLLEPHDLKLLHDFEGEILWHQYSVCFAPTKPAAAKTYRPVQDGYSMACVKANGCV